MGGEKTILLIDGEHYPPVVARAISELRERGEHPVVALLVGGREKLGQVDFDIGIPVEDASADPEPALAAAIERHGASRVTDLSDEPVLGYVERSRLASVALWKGAAYAGAGFEFTPPPRPRLARVPSVAVIGTGKRTGKTAIAAASARTYKAAGLRPVVVAMGRGGPGEPEVIDESVTLTPRVLLDWAEEGRHAASDYIEDALMARVPTVGAWRAGGGLAGATAHTNYERALERAHELGPGLLLLEGSGAAHPPAHWDAGILVVDAGIDPGHLCGYFGLYRLLLSDLVVLTMCEEPIDRKRIGAVESCIRSSPLNQPRVVCTVFRPSPLGDVSGRRVWLVTTAPKQAATVLKESLESNDATVAGISHSLADRSALSRDLQGIGGVDAILVELKAAAVDVVTRFGVERGIEVIYMDNRPQVVEGEESLEGPLLEVAEAAGERFEER